MQTKDGKPIEHYVPSLRPFLELRFVKEWFYSCDKNASESGSDNCKDPTKN